MRVELCCSTYRSNFWRRRERRDELASILTVQHLRGLRWYSKCFFESHKETGVDGLSVDLHGRVGGRKWSHGVYKLDKTQSRLENLCEGTLDGSGWYLGGMQRGLDLCLFQRVTVESFSAIMRVYDPDFASRAVGRRSVSGGEVVMCLGEDVSWFSRTRKWVALSTFNHTEPEHVPLGDIVK